MTHHFGDFSLRLFCIGWVGKEQGERRPRVQYWFFNSLDDCIFTGDEYFPPIRFDPVGRESAIVILDFLTQIPGDSGSDFTEYSKKQMQWARSKECRELAQLASEEIRKRDDLSSIQRR